jgi:hypothetical protein
MAEIVGSLFGITPDLYERQLRAQDEERAIRMANLAPGARGAAMIQSGAAGLTRGLGGLLGAEDPQMKLISARQSVIGQLDQTDPASLLKGAQMLTQMGDQQGAFALADYARKAQSDIALAQQRMRERAAADPFQQLLRTGKYTPESLAEFERTGKSQDLVLYEKPEKPEKDLRFGVDREAIAGEMFDNKSFAQLTPTQKAAVNKRVEEEQGRKAEKGAPKVYTPGSPVQPKDWMAFDQNVLSKDPTMQRTSTILSDAPSAIDIIRSSSTNDISAATLPGALARLTGEGKNMSNADVNRYARTGGLDDRLAQDAVKFFTGRTTDVKKDQAEKFAIALYRGALLERKKKLEDAAEQYGYSDSPNYKVALRQIDTQLGQFKLVKKGESAPTTAKTGDPLIDKYLFPQAESK